MTNTQTRSEATTTTLQQDIVAMLVAYDDEKTAGQNAQFILNNGGVTTGALAGLIYHWDTGNFFRKHSEAFIARMDEFFVDDLSAELWARMAREGLHGCYTTTVYIVVDEILAGIASQEGAE